MQRSQNLYDVFLKAKKVIYFCKFTFNHKIFFLFRLHRLWTLFSCLSANHYHSTGAVWAGNRSWRTRYRASRCSGHWTLHFPPSSWVSSWDPSWMETQLWKQSRAWESKQKRSLQLRKMENTAPRDTTGAAQLCFVDLVLPTGGFLPGCKGGGREVCVCSACDTPVITVTCRRLMPALSEAAQGHVRCCADNLSGVW